MMDAIGSTKGLSSILMNSQSERRSVGRTKVAKSALLFFGSARGVFGCSLRDVTNIGAGIRLDTINVLPPDFELSFDNFRTIRKCRLVWRQGDLTGVAFQN
jgi:hypothetical protein